MRDTVIPYRFNASIGNLTVERGIEDGIRLFSWDAINDCNDDQCVADSVCTYSRRGKCTIQMNYLKAFQDVVFRNYTDFTEADFYYVGMHLTPLYKTLCKLKIEELVITRVVDTDEKGIRRVNPVYKEIRETIKLINALWKGMGMTRMAPVLGDPNFGVGGTGEGGKVIEGEIKTPMDSLRNKKKTLVKRGPK